MDMPGEGSWVSDLLTPQYSACCSWSDSMGWLQGLQTHSSHHFGCWRLPHELQTLWPRASQGHCNGIDMQGLVFCCPVPCLDTWGGIWRCHVMNGNGRDAESQEQPGHQARCKGREGSLGTNLITASSSACLKTTETISQGESVISSWKT